MMRVLHALVALALGTGAALYVEHRLDAVPESLTAAGDRVLEAVDGVADNHVHVSADARSMLDEEGEAAVAAAIAERDLPVHVVVWSESRSAGYSHYGQAAEQILYRLDEPSIVVLWQGAEHSTTKLSEGYALADYEDTYQGPEREPSYLGDPAQRLVEWLDQLPDEPVERRSFDYYGGPVGGFFIGLLYASPFVGGAWVLLGLLRVSTGRRFRNR